MSDGTVVEHRRLVDLWPKLSSAAREEKAKNVSNTMCLEFGVYVETASRSIDNAPIIYQPTGYLLFEVHTKESYVVASDGHRVG